jgi:pantoate--beta-alanine ligase
MELFHDPTSMRAWSDDRCRDRRFVTLVPTMGALHAGHLALIDEARRHGDDVVVSIFVNPLQFNVGADFEGYPRPIDTDLDACDAANVTAVYAPTAATMYPQGFQTHVEPGALADRFEGEHRPGHFRGVTTVVSKLFSAVRPAVAVFGEKDAQQLAIIRRMTTDLDLGVRIVAMPTIREADGLALSSRNQRLTPSERIAATCIWKGLQAARRSVSGGLIDATAITQLVIDEIAREPAATLEYVALVHPGSFEPMAALTGAALIIVAVWFGDVRLIDNALVSG